MVFVATAFASWLFGRLADAGSRRLIIFVLGGQQDRALQQAATAAVQHTAAEASPGDEAQTAYLAMVIDQIFLASMPSEPIASRSTLLETLQASIARQVEPLSDASLTEAGTSSLDLFGLTATAVAEKLSDHLIREIKIRGALGGPLTPLADQLNHDLTQLQGKRIEDMVGRMEPPPIQGAIYFIDPVAHQLRLSLESGEGVTVKGMRFASTDSVDFVEDENGPQSLQSLDSVTPIRRWVRVGEPYPRIVRLEVTCEGVQRSDRWVVPVDIAVFPELRKRQPKVAGKLALDYPSPPYLQLKLRSSEPLTFLEVTITGGHGVRFLRASGGHPTAVARWEGLAPGESARWPIIIERNHSSEIELAINCRGSKQERWDVTEYIRVPQSVARPTKPKFDIEIRKTGSENRLQLRLTSQWPLTSLEAEIDSSTGVRFVRKDGRSSTRARHGELAPGQAIMWRLDLGDWITQFFGIDFLCSGPEQEKWAIHEHVDVPPKFQRPMPK